MLEEKPESNSSENNPFNRLLQFVTPAQFMFGLIGVILIGLAIVLVKLNNTGHGSVEVLSQTTLQQKFVVEVSGEVHKPGVYELSPNARVEDALIQAGGLTENANKVLVEKTLNRASLLKDGQKIYIPSVNQQQEVLSASNTMEGSGGSDGTNVQVSTLININGASQEQLVSLWGIGPVTAQKIIEQRPYSTIEELLSRSIVKKNVFERIQNQISVHD